MRESGVYELYYDIPNELLLIEGSICNVKFTCSKESLSFVGKGLIVSCDDTA